MTSAHILLTATFTVYLSILTLVGGGFLVVDIYHRPRWVLKHKIQKGKNLMIEKGRLRGLLNNILLNSTVVLLPGAVVLYFLLKWRDSDLSFTPPAIPTFFLHLSGFVVIEEIGFYYSHRLMHSSFLYKRVHKKHHEWTAPIGLTAVYSHPIEMLVTNLIPFLCGPVVFGSCLVTALWWFAIAFTVTIIHHSGYHLPLLPSPEFHDFHHLKFTGNYGVLGVLDRLHGTDKVFRESSRFRKHRFVFSSRTLT
ncbi:fatty acid hydroxylase domain-containing protein 2-like isoform X2 [Ostrea edulis]|uniref:fatty acid hydroxylase domain-containing protein 2-like isoform X2 n=1 Tax=Ostrea edulis TaxID=37623 RepID=UPI0020953CB3|nr:fatty acid hydroxylase domain-containing protein 2-like isoform X2 [Ostrea edulis]